MAFQDNLWDNVDFSRKWGEVYKVVLINMFRFGEHTLSNKIPLFLSHDIKSLAGLDQ